MFMASRTQPVTPGATGYPGGNRLPQGQPVTPGVIGCNRFARFTNKDTLYESVLLDDICGPITTIRGAISTMSYPDYAHFMIDEAQFSNILNNAEFYKRIVREQPLLFERSITNGLYQVNASILKQYKMDPIELDYRAHFFAANHVALFKHWIENDFNVNAAVLSDWYHSWSTVCWSQSLP